jgi:hypothetical protein
MIEYLHAGFGGFTDTLGSPATFATTVSLKESTDALIFGLISHEP